MPESDLNIKMLFRQLINVICGILHLLLTLSNCFHIGFHS
jgi:hypothetical protein